MREDELDRLALSVVNTIITEYGVNLVDSGKFSKCVSAARMILKEEGVDDAILVNEEVLTIMSLRITLGVMKSWGAMGYMGLAITQEDLASSIYKRKCVKAAYQVLRKALESKDMMND